MTEANSSYVMRITRCTYVDVTVEAASVEQAVELTTAWGHDSEWEPPIGWDGYRVDVDLAPVGEFGEPEISSRAGERRVGA